VAESHLASPPKPRFERELAGLAPIERVEAVALEVG
jgi:hypothetical protein